VDKPVRDRETRKLEATVATDTFDDSGDDLVEKAKKDRASKKGPFGRMALFIRQVFDELAKVVTPTRKELVNYTIVVLIFVLIMMAIISVLDLFFGWGISWIFGDGRALFG
jgi:preprotein translocase subunit SecE